MKLENQKIARLVSNIFLPPFNNFYLFFFFALYFELDQREQIEIILISIVFGVVLPIIFFLIQRKRGKISNEDASIKEERGNPYIFGAMLSLIALFIASYLALPDVILSVWFSYIIASIVLFLVNKFWKISAHLIGVSIPIMWIVLFTSNEFVLLFLILPIIAWSRVLLKIHTVLQVIVGATTGIILVLLSYYSGIF